MTRSTARPGALRRGMRLGVIAALLALSLGIVPAASAATLAGFPGSNAAVSGNWTNPGNASADDGLYATAVVARNTTAERSYGHFGLDSIPAGSSITSVTIEIQYRLVSDRDDVVMVQAYVNGTPSGAAGTSVGGQLSDTTLATSMTAPVSRGQLLDGIFSVRVSSARPNNGNPTDTSTFSLDYVKATVTYAPPDGVPPVVTVPANMTVEATSAAGAVATFSASAVDDVDGSRPTTCGPASGSTFPLGATTVTCTAADLSGNTGSASFTVTVRDTTPPTVTPPANVTTAATGPSGATVAYGAASASDLVSGSVPATCLPASGSTFALGATTVTCSATDAAGNTGSATFTVTVVDASAPVVTVPSNITAEATSAAGAVVTFSASALDDIDGARPTTCTPAAGATFPLGATTVTCTATDAAGNTGSASFTVTVVDTTAPVVTVPANVTAAATSPSGATVAYGPASATDLVDGTLTTTCTPASGSAFPVATTTVTCSATDAAGNAGSNTFDVTVTPYVDGVPPVVTVAADITREATSAAGAAVTFSASAVDDIDGPLTPSCSPASGSTFALGTTTVTCTAIDAAGNTGSDTFTVTVVDTTPPAISGTPADATVPATSPAGAVVGWAAPTATDLVDGTVAVVCAPASGSLFPVGMTAVTCTATDAAGNAASTSFDVTVNPYVDQAPVLTLPGPTTEEATGPTGAAVTFSVTANDVEDGALTPTCTPASGSTFALGSTTVDCSVTDSASNTATGSFSVTVVDTTPPALTVPANVTTAATSPSGATVTYAAASATDLVDGTLTPTCAPASGSLFPAGTTTVTCSATDAAGNTGSGTFTVTVTSYVDEAPTIDLPADITTEATGAAGAVVTYTATANDLEDGSLTPTCAPASGSVFALGTTTVICSATDSASNTTTGSFTVTVVDTTPPDVDGPDDMTLEATGPAGAKADYTVSADDLVDGAVAVRCSRNAGAMFPLGATTVTCTATDDAGNTGSASFTVTVVDTTPPAVTVPADVTTPATGPTGAVVTYAATAVDLVDGDVPPTCAPASGSLFAVGTTTVTCSASDAAGNSTGDAVPADESGTYSFVVTVTPYDGPVPSTPPTATNDPAGAATTGLLPFVGLSIAGAAGLFALLAAIGWRRRYPMS